MKRRDVCLRESRGAMTMGGDIVVRPAKEVARFCPIALGDGVSDDIGVPF